jgi:glutathione S-transferase
LQRARLQQWLGFISTELHKAVFIPLLDPHAPDEVKRYAREKIALRMGMLQEQLAANDYLLDGFSVADAYLFAVLNWVPYTGVDLALTTNGY